MTIFYREHFKKKNTENSDFLKQIFAKRGFLDTRIILLWVKIIGQETADFYQPNKIFIDKHQNIKTLELISANQLATSKFSFYKSTIIEKINRFYGYQYIENVTLKKNTFC